MISSQLWGNSAVPQSIHQHLPREESNKLIFWNSGAKCLPCTWKSARFGSKEQLSASPSPPTVTHLRPAALPAALLPRARTAVLLGRNRCCLLHSRAFGARCGNGCEIPGAAVSVLWAGIKCARAATCSLTHGMSLSSKAKRLQVSTGFVQCFPGR